MATTNEGRDANGKFAMGNSGGPGRPRRAVEQSYLRALRDNLPVEVWGEIVAKAVSLALEGDAVARQWLGRYALGADPPSLLRLAAIEAANEGEEHLVQDAADDYRRGTMFRGLKS